MAAAARVGDLHICPLITGNVAHKGGPVLAPGASSVLIGNQPAARVGDLLVCTGAIDTIVTGSATVFIVGLPAARQGDTTAHGGTIIEGFPNVIIG